MDGEELAETGMAMLYEAILDYLYNADNVPTKRHGLTSIGIPSAIAAEALKELERAGKVERTRQLSYWRLSPSEHPRTGLLRVLAQRSGEDVTAVAARLFPSGKGTIKEVRALAAWILRERGSPGGLASRE